MVESSKATMRRSDAPWVVGRSGPRPEVGRGTSGCLGEVYKTVENPQAMQKFKSQQQYHSFPFWLVPSRSLSYHFFHLKTCQFLLPHFILVIIFLFHSPLSAQMNTAVQRSWLYYKDPMLCYKDGEAVPEPIQPPQVCSLPGIGDSASAPPPFNPEANNKRVAKLTR